jgi:CHAT domain-containing protein/tetratricopeptide (TPR) repeat protein
MAQDEKSSWGQGEAHRILGLLALHAAKYPEARLEYDQALSLFESVPSPPKIALVHSHIGAVANLMGQRSEAAEQYRQALTQFEALGDLRSQANVLENLLFVETIAPDERKTYIGQGLVLSRKIGDKNLEGAFLHHIGDDLFSKGDFAGAIEKLKEAAACFEAAGNGNSLAYVWTSMGRLYRMHGAYDEAISSYQKGLLIQQNLGDKIGVIQSLNAMAISFGLSGHSAEAMNHYERALALAKETGSPRVIAFMTGNFGGALIGGGDYKRAIELLEESLRLDPSSPIAGNRYMQLSGAYRRTLRYQQALENANDAVKLLRKGDNSDILYQAFQERAHVFQGLERYTEALADTQDAIQVVEQIRGKLVPLDYLKQGYAGKTQDLFADAIQIQENLGLFKEAMVMAEEARARAFLDLLASRSLDRRDSQRMTLTASNGGPGNMPAASTTSGGSPSAGKRELTTRGSAPLPAGTPNVAAAMPSPVSVAAPTYEQLVATSKRLDSTFLSFWIMPDATYVWVLRPDGTARSVRLPIRSEQLSKLIRDTSYGEQELREESAGATTNKVTAGAAPSTAARGSQRLRLRGGGELVLGGERSKSWAELYKLLILPVQQSLPPRGSHLTIVPQGPLFQLSFAALQDSQGHYLVENYALNYAPSLGVLQLTGERKQQLGKRVPHYLIVADPLIVPDSSTETELPSLPGARQEARSLIRLLPHGETTMLMGTAATKEAVREQLAGKTVLHFATHAIVRDDQPLDSFLALGSGRNSSPGAGHLTMQEIYGMDLQTDLVVLSACSTARGKVSGDGIAGLTRAFFYGGAPSVIAAMWDVADEPTSQLMSNFYSSIQKDPDKSRALRAAQLRLMGALRAGSVHVNTSLGPATLPEDPVFWAGFVLQGEP